MLEKTWKTFWGFVGYNALQYAIAYNINLGYTVIDHTLYNFGIDLPYIHPVYFIAFWFLFVIYKVMLRYWDCSWKYIRWEVMNWYDKITGNQFFFQAGIGFALLILNILIVWVGQQTL